MTIETVILQKAATIMAEIPWVKKVNAEKLLLDISQAREHEFPLVQLISAGKIMRPVQRRHQIDWTLVLTAAMRPTNTDFVDNQVLEERERDIILKIGENTQFNTGVPNSPVIQWQISATDPIVRVADPFQIITVTSIITYEAPFSGNC